MTTRVKVTAIGNSEGIILPKAILAKLRVSKGDTLSISEIPDGIGLTPYNEKISRQLEVAERVMRENRNMLRKLAQ